MTKDNAEEQSTTEESTVEHAESQMSRNKKIAVIVCAAIFVIILIVVLCIQISRQQNTQDVGVENTNTNAQAIVELPKKLPRVIDGVKVERGKENFLPVAIMIENAAFGGVRPQAALQEASIVYEALAEGGITRFMAVYASGEPLVKIGPVRSARPYYVDWAEEYKGVYIHAGGSPQALQKIAASSEFRDINQVAGQQAYFYRDSQAQAREHGLFTTTELIAYALRDYQLSDAHGSFVPWAFQEKQAELDDRPSDVGAITIPFSTASYEVVYTYDREKNVYMRSHGTTPHVDQLTGTQIEVKNIAVQYVDTGILEASSGRLRMTTVGEGNAVIFYNGTAHEAKWKKETENGRTVFTDLEGNAIEFIPGNIWVEAVPSDRVVVY